MALTSPMRFLPFSHNPGTMCLIPGSHLACQIFPAMLCVYDSKGASRPLIGTVRFSDLGPLDQFCVQQDLEKGRVIVSGFAPSGFVRYIITALQDGGSWKIECKKQMGNIAVELDNKAYKVIKEGDVGENQSQTITFCFGNEPSKALSLPPRERLTLGIDKSQEWSQVVRRCQMQEILPYWYWLAQSVARPTECAEMVDAPSLYKNLQQAIQHKQRDEIVGHLKALFVTGFGHQLVCRVTDSDFHGYPLPVVASADISPGVLLEHTFRLIRSLFFTEHEGSLAILPLLPPEFACGTLSGITTSKGHSISIEWTKHVVRRVQIIASVDDELDLEFQKQITGFRLEKCHFSTPARLKIRANHIYLLDNFQK